VTSFLLVLVAALVLPIRLPRPSIVWDQRLGLSGPDEQKQTESDLPMVRLVGSLGVGLSVIWYVGGLTGAVLGVPAALLAWRSLSSQSKRDRQEQERIARALPDAVVLLGALIRAGLPDTVALRLVGSATPGVLGDRISTVARGRELGQDVTQAWSPMLAHIETSSLADAMIRSAQSGAPVAELLDRVSQDARRHHHTVVQAAARAAGVRVVLPLGLCYLPSFLLLAVVPIVAALSSGLGMWLVSVLTAFAGLALDRAQLDSTVTWP
jgi:pilus assembly protein TadC